MRTDVKVGLICVFAIILGVVIYFVAQGNNRPKAVFGGTTTIANATLPASPASVSPAPASSPAVTTLDVAPVTPMAPAGNTQLAAASPAGSGVSGGIISLPTPGTPVSPSGSTTAPAATIPSVSGVATPPLSGGTISIIPATTSPSRTGYTGSPSPSIGSPYSGSPYGSGTTGNTGRGTIDIDNHPPIAPHDTFTFNGSGSSGNTLTGSAGLSGSAATYTIQKGDMLGTIAKKYNVSVKALEAANPGVDSTRLKIGKTISIPAPSAATDTITTATTTRPAATRSSRAAAHPVAGSAAPAAPKPGTSYTMKKGDTLSKLATEVYGNKSAWQKIFRANRGDIADPNSIPVGTVIKLPS